MVKGKIICVIIFLSVALALFVQYQVRAPKRDFSDYRVYYNAGRGILSGENIYVYESKEITPFKYAPVFAVFMAPFAVFSKGVSAGLFFILNLFCLYFIFMFSKKLIFFDGLGFRKECLISITVFVLSFRAILHCLHSGQVGILILFLVLYGLFFISRGKDIRGAFFIGFAVMIKYMPFLFVIYFFLKKKYKAGLFVAISMCAYAILPGFFVGFRSNFLYIRQWLPHITSTSLDGGSLLDIKNHSIWTMVRRFMPFDHNLLATLIVIAVFFVFMFFIVSKNKVAYKNDEIKRFYSCVDYGMIFIVMALFNPNAWLHNFVVLIFPYMIATYYLFRCNFKDRIVLVLLIASFILSSSGSYAIMGKAMQAAFEYYCAVIIASIILFGILARIKIKGDMC